MRILKSTAMQYAAVIIASSAAGVGASSLAITASASLEQPRYSTNSSGQTFGPAIGDLDPDLILAEGDRGTLGYVLAIDLVGPAMSSPSEVGTWLKANPQDQPRSIPLYDSSGTKTGDTFTIEKLELGTLPPK